VRYNDQVVATVKLLIVRHGETAWTRERFGGMRDIALVPRGHAQAEAVARALADRALTAVYSSPLERARATAETIAKPHQLGVRIEPLLRDIHYGRWEGLTPDEIIAQDRAAWTTWRSAPHTLDAHGGETVPAVAARVGDLLGRVRDAHADQTVVFVTHAIVIRLIVLAALGLGPDRVWSIGASPAGITEVELGRDFTTVHRMNTLAHLADLA
jgi:broad specificity phosphatase PhoE